MKTHVFWHIVISFIISFSSHLSFAENKLNIGTSLDNPPFEYLKDNKPTGFDIELIETIASKMGRNIEIKDMDLASLIPALNANKIDIIAAGLNETEERKKNINFSISYFEDYYTLLILKNKNFTKLEEIHGKSLGAQLGTVHANFIKKYDDENKANLNILELTKISQLIEELKLGRIEAIIIDNATAIDITAQNDQLKFAKLAYKMEGGIAFGFAKNSLLVEEVDEIIKEMKKNGELEKLYDKYFSGDKSNSSHTSKLNKNIKYIAHGILDTIGFSCIVICIGFIFATFLSYIYFRNNQLLQLLINCYTAIMRGTPLLVQISLIYFCLPRLFPNLNITAFEAGIIAFSLNSTAYISVILISNMKAIEKGQIEASFVLGFNEVKRFKHIIFPQSIRNAMPALLNELADLIKESSLLAVIGVAEITRRAQIVASQEYDYLTPMMIAAVIYFILISSINLIIKYVNHVYYKNK